MPVRFNPSGELNVSADASDLPFTTDGKVIQSEAMTRCTNLHLDRYGVASTRKGSSRLSDAAVGIPVHRIVEQGGIRYAFGGAQIYRNGVSLGVSGLTSAKWSSIKYNAFNVPTQSIFALNGTDRKRITGSTVAEWGIDPPVAMPTLSGSVTGYAYLYDWEATYHAIAGSFRFGTEITNHQITYDWEEDIPANGSDSETYRHMWAFEVAASYTNNGRVGVVYTYCRKDGATLESESNPSSAAYVAPDSGVYVTWVASPDPQVTHVRLYRTLDGGETFLYSHEVAIGTTSDNILASDNSLGAEVEYDHDRPLAGTVVVGPDFNGTCFLLKDNLLYFCKPNQPEYWPALYYVEVCPMQEDTIGLGLYNGQAYVLTTSEVYLIQGTGHKSFFPLRQSAVTGAVAQDGILALRGQGLLRVASDGMWAFSGGDDVNITNPNFRTVFEGQAVQGIGGRVLANMGNCWLITHLGKIYFGFPGGSATYPSEILVLDLGTKKVVHYAYDREFSAVCVDETNKRILAADASGDLWSLEDTSVATDNGDEISWDWQSAEASDQLRMYTPRSAKYDVKVEGNATAQVILNGASIQDHLLNGSRITTKRLITGNNGKRLQSRIYGTGTVSIYSVELE
jgi:hypothetical protein